MLQKKKTAQPFRYYELVTRRSLLDRLDCQNTMLIQCGWAQIPLVLGMFWNQFNKRGNVFCVYIFSTFCRTVVLAIQESERASEGTWLWEGKNASQRRRTMFE